MTAYGAIRGWKGQLDHMVGHKNQAKLPPPLFWYKNRQCLCRLQLGGDRVTFTLAYVSSMVLTLWAAMIQHSYLLTVVFCAVQVKRNTSVRTILVYKKPLSFISTALV